MRIIGVCFGHQIVGRAMGVKVARSEDGGWETSVTAVDLTKRGQEIFGKTALVLPFSSSFEKQELANKKVHRRYIRCIEILYMTTPREPSSLDTRRNALCKECTFRNGSLRYRDIRSLMRRL